jgi:hypothetical protein
MLTKSVLNTFQKNGVRNYKLLLKMGDIFLVTHAINGLGLANNSQVKGVCVHKQSVEVCKMGNHEESTVRIPCILFKFRLPHGKSYQLTRKQFPLQLAYAMTYLNFCKKFFSTLLHQPLVMISST